MVFILLCDTDPDTVSSQASIHHSLLFITGSSHSWLSSQNQARECIEPEQVQIIQEFQVFPFPPNSMLRILAAIYNLATSQAPVEA